MLLTIGDLSARTHYLNARQTLRKLLDWRAVAVVNENDTTATDEISFGDNDFLAAQVAMLVGADLLVLLTNIDGLYSADPRIDPAASLIEEVTDFGALQELEIGHTTSVLGSGGMRSKVVAADMATAAGVRDGDLQRPARGGAGDGARRRTRGDAVRAARERAQLVQAVAEVREARPRQARDRRGRRAGAARGQREPAPRRRGERGGRVRRGRRGRDRRPTRAEAETIAKGICNYSAQELRRVIGMKTEAVRGILPHATDEAVHRDYLVVG